MTWVLAIGAGWLLLSVLVAVLIGRSVRLADARAEEELARDEPNYVVDPGTAPRGMSAATVLPFPAAAAKPPATPPSQPAGSDVPTVPGIPVARPPAPGAGSPGKQVDPIRRTGLG